jgi:tetratricopeptide (TPR) repeat protein
MTRSEHDLARILFFRAIRMDRRNASAWYHLGLLYRDGFGYNEAALEQFNIFVRLEQIADQRVQRVQRMYIPELQEAIARSAADRPGASKRNSAASASEIAKAEAAMKRRNFKTARLSYEAALKLDPLSYPAALGLANCYEKSDASKSGQQKAFENYKLACQLRPSAVSTFLTAGALAMRLGNYAQAVTIYSRALAANPSKIDAIDGLIRALRKTGVKEKMKIASAYQNYRDSIPVVRKR